LDYLAAGMLAMFLDKCGAVTVLSAFKAIVKQKLRVNLTCTIGLAENSINENAYRPSDIIVSRKGLTVEIGNTDAEGRLVLADCMNWVQEKFKVKTLIELSTLTGAIITALGHEATGFFTNSEKLYSEMREIGERVHELSWHMPCTDYHKRIVSPKHCDLTNSAGKTEASSSQAAAFLKSFVE
jgi:leucyl aminopeptidase